jgi:simple sugar transport system permease protein
LTYLAVVVTIIISFFLWRTRWGLIIRAVGESAAAVDTSGHSVAGARYLAVLAAGALAALGGAALAVGQAQTFTNNMSGGRGFVALTAAVLGRWNPGLALAAALLFGAVDAFQLRLQISLAGGSSYIIQSTPALMAIIAIVAAGKAARYPANIGMPYRREQRL